MNTELAGKYTLSISLGFDFREKYGATNNVNGNRALGYGVHYEHVLAQPVTFLPPIKRMAPDI